MRQKTLAWLVHLYTASGAVFGMLALIAAAQNQTRGAFGLLLVAFVIDGTDGILARRVRVSEVLPKFSGAYVDNAVDVLTYIFVPIFIMAWEELLPHPLWTAVPTLAAMYAYGQADMKTEDHYFLGFPSYWNVVALYMYWLQPTPVWAVVMVVAPAVLTFVPTRYLYPSRNSIFWRTSWSLGGVWLALLAWLLLQPDPDWRWVLISLYYPLYYFVMSFYLDLKLRWRHAPS
ncbi:MAG: CDP-alcohol phosphatidyltransferase family protein [Candidatus Hydrogenedentes bacterium]|nr:CDP-alcohol phosphatidyltransferase family protein [Candidatus Hydrogenedentota bacterium]